MKKLTYAQSIYKRLRKMYPNAHCELQFKNAYELLVATVLSAQCTDARVNVVVPFFYKQYPDPAQLAHARQSDVEKIIHSTGFYRNKAKNLIKAAEIIEEKFNGEVPSSMDELVTLPGVGRKTANVILGNAFKRPLGIAVDTHVQRLSLLLGFTHHTDPLKIEVDLMSIFKRSQWTMITHLLIFHGRKICVARKPRCQECSLSDICPSAYKFSFL